MNEKKKKNAEYGCKGEGREKKITLNCESNGMGMGIPEDERRKACQELAEFCKNPRFRFLYIFYFRVSS